jgi:hypothetical protein
MGAIHDCAPAVGKNPEMKVTQKNNVAYDKVLL